MTEKEKQLLLKDLYARLPYGVKILHKGWNYEWDQELSTIERITGIDENFIYTKVIDKHTGDEYRDDKWPISTFDDKPYLRSMSNMTEEEHSQYMNFIEWSYNDYDGTTTTCIDKEKLHEYLNFIYSHHLDDNNFIEKGLALEAPEGMYKIE